MNDHMHALEIRALADGGIELEQQCGLDEPDVVHLHPTQVRLLAERAGLVGEPGMRLAERQRAWLMRLASSVDEIRQFHIDSILDRCADGVEIALRLRAAEDALDDLMRSFDFERIDDQVATAATRCSKNTSIEIVTNGDEGEGASHENSAAISVTRRGRPRTEHAMSAAERQRRHRDRARQAELPALALAAEAP